MKKERIVLDTNCLILSVPLASPYHAVWNSFLDGRNYLCVSTEILSEYEEIISRFWGVQIADLILNTITTNRYTIYSDPSFRFGLIKNDTDDNKFVDCAICANAKFIVTEDHHFNILKQIDFPKVETISIDEYLASLLLP